MSPTKPDFCPTLLPLYFRLLLHSISTLCSSNSEFLVSYVLFWTFFDLQTYCNLTNNPNLTLYSTLTVSFAYVTVALQMMGEGDHWRVYCPWNLAYGAEGTSQALSTQLINTAYQHPHHIISTLS